MKSILKIFLSLSLLCCCLFFLACDRAFAAEAFRATETGNNLEVTTPYGSKLFLGDMGFDSTENYSIEIPLKDLRPSAEGQAAPTAPGGAQGNANAGPKPSEMEDEDRLVLEANRLYNQGKFAESLGFVEEILRRNPKHVRAWIMKGSLMHAQGQKDLAKKSWTEALKLEPDNSQIKKLLEKY